MGKVRDIKASINEKMDLINQSMVSYNISRYYMSIAEERGVSYEEAIELCSSDPELSLGAKMADPEAIFMCCTKKGKARFRSRLSPEEAAIFDKDADKIRRAVLKGNKKKAAA